MLKLSSFVNIFSYYKIGSIRKELLIAITNEYSYTPITIMNRSANFSSTIVCNCIQTENRIVSWINDSGSC